jgi:hypothetical protein
MVVRKELLHCRIRLSFSCHKNLNMMRKLSNSVRSNKWHLGPIVFTSGPNRVLVTVGNSFATLGYVDYSSSIVYSTARLVVL